ncbi:M15 family metallopeptidase [Serratia rubidaea]|uniref:M15 family metallopeptidase n=1 Tax=Serratia rubidaea TaxID=61652 RepID=UPI0023B07986|nr:M15 family metallopeptidase [Serratia rubidaea]MDK1703024.1 M15 family metallopeptidase [Serratia rubidaea]
MRLCLAFFSFFAFFPALADEVTIQSQRPDDFVNVERLIPQIQTDIRYFSANNFVGRRVEGYQEPVCLLTKKTALALKSVVASLISRGLTIKVYDCYRPQEAVNDFVEWAKVLKDTKMRTEFYPSVDKTRLFTDGYIAARSGHSRGSTLDLTIIPLGSKIPAEDTKRTLENCTKPKLQRSPDNSLDFGTGFDCFSPVSHPDYLAISAQARANRLLLQLLMEHAGFKPLDTEWWHFTLIEESYPNTYFDFPVKNQ